jgi:LysM repeat protein
VSCARSTLRRFVPACVPVFVIAVVGLSSGLLATSTVTVRSGDSLSRIAAQHNTTVRAIVDANGITNPDHIRIGQSLVIPEPSVTTAPTTTVGTSTGAGATTSTTILSVTAAPPATTSRPEDLPQAPASAVPKDINPNGTNYGALTVTTYFVVQPGDSFASIARRFDLDRRRLAASNGLYGTETLVPGQLLRIA